MKDFDTEMSAPITVSEAERFFPGFEFLGFGWYHDPERGSDTMLVAEGDDKEIHHFYFYMDRDPREEFRTSGDSERVKVGNLPVHS